MHPGEKNILIHIIHNKERSNELILNFDLLEGTIRDEDIAKTFFIKFKNKHVPYREYLESYD